MEARDEPRFAAFASLKEAAGTLSELETLIAQLVEQKKQMRLSTDQIVFDEDGLVDLHRHLRLILGARLKRITLAAENRWASRDSGGVAADQPAESAPDADSKSSVIVPSVTGQDVRLSSIDDVFVSIKQFRTWIDSRLNAEIHLLIDGEIDTRGTRDADFVRNVILISDFEQHVQRETGRQNQAQAAAAGRPSGPRRRLAVADRAQARRMYDQGHMTVAEIANHFGVGRGTIYRALDEEKDGRSAESPPRARRSPAVPRGAHQDRRAEKE